MKWLIAANRDATEYSTGSSLILAWRKTRQPSKKMAVRADGQLKPKRLTYYCGSERKKTKYCVL